MTVEQDIADLRSQMPRSVRRDLSDGHSHPSSPLRAKVLIPQTLLSFDGGTAQTATPNTTTAIVGLVRLDSAIVANRITYFPLGSGPTPR